MAAHHRSIISFVGHVKPWSFIGFSISSHVFCHAEFLIQQLKLSRASAPVHYLKSRAVRPLASAVAAPKKQGYRHEIAPGTCEVRTAVRSLMMPRSDGTQRQCADQHQIFRAAMLTDVFHHLVCHNPLLCPINLQYRLLSAPFFTGGGLPERTEKTFFEYPHRRFPSSFLNPLNGIQDWSNANGCVLMLSTCYPFPASSQLLVLKWNIDGALNVVLSLKMVTF